MNNEKLSELSVDFNELVLAVKTVKVHITSVKKFFVKFARENDDLVISVDFKGNTYSSKVHCEGDLYKEFFWSFNILAKILDKPRVEPVRFIIQQYENKNVIMFGSSKFEI